MKRKREKEGRKEAINIGCKKWKVKESGAWREKYIIERRTSERERRKPQIYDARSGRGKKVVNV